MSEMVERVGRALAKQEGYAYDPEPYDARARAAIEAMREPTEAMWDAAEEHNSGGGGIMDDGSLERNVYDLEKVWPAMIDAALK